MRNDSELVPAVSDRDHVQGPSDAPITLVEYGDYQCPACGQAYPVVKAVQQRLGDRLRFVFRNFPLPQHAHAEHAAEVAEACAAAGGNDAFWTIHDTLYEHQNALDDDSLARYVERAHVDLAQVKAELRHGTPRQHVREDIESGEESGVQGTPAFFVNGMAFDGDWSDAEAFADALSHASAGR